jgi:hypothetical protein
MQLTGDYDLAALQRRRTRRADARRHVSRARQSRDRR